jgi:hypothetical protein
MLYPFFALAAVSPSRQRSFRAAALAHVVVATLAAWAVAAGVGSSVPLPVLGYVLLIAGMVEGAVLIGWRLTQLPKSQALEFLLVSALEPRQFFAAEALVGLARLALITMLSLPVLVMLALFGHLEWIDLLPLLLMPFTWGALVGLGLTCWAYEPLTVRCWGERVFLGLVLLYLTLGVLIGENLVPLLQSMPAWARDLLGEGLRHLHEDNPFSILRAWLTLPPQWVWQMAAIVELGVLVVVGICFVRAAARLKGHFHERHYRPITDPKNANRGQIADRPLSWWAVRRVREYSGRVNLWLAGGFGILFAVYIVAGPHWPAWLGRSTFELVEQACGGVGGVATALVLLSAVPAAFQYGLWDSHAQNRSQRLELLLLTDLQGTDYWNAAAAAAWSRGRGYFAVALLLWVAAALAGQATFGQVLAAASAAVLLWGLYFALGFWAFSRGLQANSLGSLLVIGLPLLGWGLARSGVSVLVPLLPPGTVYMGTTEAGAWAWTLGAVLCAALALGLGWSARTRCQHELRQWYNLHHGVKALT